MRSTSLRAHVSALPKEARVAPLYAGAFLADAFAIDLPPGDPPHDALSLARMTLEKQAPWVERLMDVRDGVVKLFGLKTADALRADTTRTPRVGFFRIYETHGDEVVLGEDDRHLDFRVSVLRRPAAAGGHEMVLVTVVHCHNLLGRNYIRLIAPFHRMVVRSSLNRAFGGAR
ncbi:DUF2867 domain-containing protein [Variovorax sp. dw_954]|uniref:DUF2867 domain-containing protein n=1 Tax=Variovorax sp. dw_954 TaxID=2720078 RepID=UPI001BD62704|nr:DUF2867 domain-containing protein [Variovorax sp. dw_954]